VSYKIEITKRAEKDLDGLDRSVENQVRDQIKKLGLDPYHLSQPVRMEAGERKARVRDWRIFLEIDDAARKITILAVRHRKRAYSNQ
jgi:mRNA-degrading endonuclease RelE of RelBE toxin-antitoxin system